MTTEERQTRKVRRLNFRIIEAEIGNYHHSKAELTEYVNNLKTITFPGRHIDESGIMAKGTTSDPTGGQAVKLAESHEMAGVMHEMARRVDAIEWALSRLSDGHCKLVQLYYWGNTYYTPERIAAELHCDKRTFFRWKRQIVHTVAQRLGWKV